MSLPWIGRAPGVPYFVTDAGAPWTPIGQNDALPWYDFQGVIGRSNMERVRGHLAWLRGHGVTCLRFMLEYAESGGHFFEQPAGVFNPVVVQAWDDLLPLIEEHGMRVLLTPMDTYFHWVRWDLHPYNAANGGPCTARTRLMVCPEVRQLIKNRLRFATERWGGSGVIFAWDLWNEMHPVQGEDRPDCFDDYISDVGPWLRGLEARLHGRAHLQTVSVFGPELHWKPWLNEPVFRHPCLDFANNHFYEEGTIDHPADTVAPALAAGKLVGEALAEITDGRPFFDTEHGPIHTFKDHGRTLPAVFDDEYFRHMQWAHLASGGAGGGMRWPNRHPHVLTDGMRQAQLSLSRFVALVDWLRFERRILNGELRADDPDVACFGCGDARQAVLWLLRTRPLLGDGRVDAGVRGPMGVVVPGLAPGRYEAALWDTLNGCQVGTAEVEPHEGAHRVVLADMGADVAVAVRLQ